MPRGRNPLILILALVSGAAAFMLSLQMTKAPAAKNNVAAPSNVKLVVHAVNDIAIGSIIKKSDIDVLAPSGNYNPKMVYENVSDVMGKVVRRNVLKGEMIKKLDILAEGDNLAALIPKGYRAMTIPVMLPSSITELLQIGNRVDVILTYDVAKGDINSLTLVENARVIGVSKQAEGGGVSGGNKKMDITLAVTPEGAETLAFSMKRGTLNLSIRSLDEEDEEKFFTLKELFFPEAKDKVDPNQLLEPETPKVPKDLVEIIRGVRKEQYATSMQ
ncbi:MAG TPA: Flp pilus assembly protein CpaB [Verrucomicrobiae bacterium]|jgi:pilus assembly protein CpaB|nr:Flp pilus assembly protein CpaB [Verrucomicrobiae bacterium]